MIINKLSYLLTTKTWIVWEYMGEFNENEKIIIYSRPLLLGNRELKKNYNKKQLFDFVFN